MLWDFIFYLDVVGYCYECYLMDWMDTFTYLSISGIVNATPEANKGYGNHLGFLKNAK